jgi:hypothetical protein
MPKFDTSFNFGANVVNKPRESAKKPSAARKKRRRGTSSKGRKHFAAMHGS